MGLICVLIADVSGSTPLYEREGNARALEEVDKCLSQMKTVVGEFGGDYISSKGDDILALFQHPDKALEAAREMLARQHGQLLSIHIGVYRGRIIHSGENVYGKPVYTAARLAALAKPGEVLLGDSCYPTMSQPLKDTLSHIGTIQLKGKAKPMDVYSHVVSYPDQLGEVTLLPMATRMNRASFAVLSFGPTEWRVSEGESFQIGRASDGGLVIQEAWVSRHHATLSVANGLVEFRDHSSTGSFIIGMDAQEIEICRRSVTLTGAGSISLGLPHDEPQSTPIQFEVAAIAELSDNAEQAEG